MCACVCVNVCVFGLNGTFFFEIFIEPFKRWLRCEKNQPRYYYSWLGDTSLRRETLLVSGRKFAKYTDTAVFILNRSFPTNRHTTTRRFKIIAYALLLRPRLMHISLSTYKNIIMFYCHDFRQVADYVQNLYIMIYCNSVILFLFYCNYSFIVHVTV